MQLRRESRVRQSPITVRLGTDSVNPFRQQTYKSFVGVAVKPQTAKPPCRPAALPFPIRAVFESCSEGHRWVFEPGVSYHVLASLTARGRPRSDQASIQLRQLTFYG